MGLLTIQWAPIELIRVGDYTGSISALGEEAWPGIGNRPARGRMAERDYGLLLLACGVLSMRLGRMRQTKSFEAAKDMLSESARLLAGGSEEFAALLYLGTAYSDGGEYGEALTIADSILEMETDAEVVVTAAVLKATALKRQGMVIEAWATIESAKSLADEASDISKGNYFVERGNLQRRRGNLDQAISEYDEAEECFLRAGSVLYVGVALNNVAGVYVEQQRFGLAHNAASRAASLFHKAGDRAFEAKALDQRANILLAQNMPSEAEPIARRAVSLLQAGDNRSWLAEALITHGRCLMRMGTEQAFAQLEMAAEICEHIGDHSQAEEASQQLHILFQHSRSFSKNLRDVIRKLEHSIIKRALKLNGNRIPPTAHCLGISRQLLRKYLASVADCVPNKRRRAKAVFTKP